MRGFYRIWYAPAMLRSSVLFQAVALLRMEETLGGLGLLAVAEKP
jgi:hypothetical protein